MFHQWLTVVDFVIGQFREKKNNRGRQKKKSRRETFCSHFLLSELESSIVVHWCTALRHNPKQKTKEMERCPTMSFWIVQHPWASDRVNPGGRIHILDRLSTSPPNQARISYHQERWQIFLENPIWLIQTIAPWCILGRFATQTYQWFYMNPLGGGMVTPDEVVPGKVDGQLGINASTQSLI